MRKKMRLHRLNLLLAVGSLLVVPASGAVERVEITRGAILSSSCAGCHGTDGASPAAIPSIAGKTAEFIENAMLDFRSGKRPGTVMNRHASGYTDEEIRLIAEFFATRE